MPVEIEIKLKIDHLAPVRDRLREIGARRVSEVLETNIFFDTADRVLLASDRGLRLRRSHDVITHADHLALSFKGPRGEGPIKKREELELVVDNQQTAIEMLSQLGYDIVLTFEKRRESWQIDHGKVELDCLPELGSFVEIECRSQADVLKIQDKLGLSKVPGVLQTYPDLVSHHLSDRGERETTLKFH